MFREILVPLDGSKLSEASHEAAAALAEHFESSVVLLHVIEQNPPAEVHHERHLRTAQEARVYLERLAAAAFRPGMRVEAHVHEDPASDVARAIVEHASAEFRADLIVTCTHGRGGIRDLLFGSIAQQIVARGEVPLLLIKPGRAGFRVSRILVPLDPDSRHEGSLEPAAVLARAFDASLELLSVVPTVATLAGEEAAASSLMPTAAQAILGLREEQAADHLLEHVETLRARGLGATSSIARGDPAAQILLAADRGGADMIILSTHRRMGLEAFWSKSVAPRVAKGTQKPLLLLPIG